MNLKTAQKTGLKYHTAPMGSTDARNTIQLCSAKSKGYGDKNCPLGDTWAAAERDFPSILKLEGPFPRQHYCPCSGPLPCKSEHRVQEPQVCLGTEMVLTFPVGTFDIYHEPKEILLG